MPYRSFQRRPIDVCVSTMVDDLSAPETVCCMRRIAILSRTNLSYIFINEFYTIEKCRKFLLLLFLSFGIFEKALKRNKIINK